MKQRIGLIGKTTELLALGAAAAILLSACGGGGGGGGGTTGGGTVGGGGGGGAGPTPVASYIADAQSPSFDGWWFNTNSAGSPASAVAEEHTMLYMGTGGNYVYSISQKALIKGTWTNQAYGADFVLISTGWTQQSALGTFVDSGDGIHATLTNGDATTYAYSLVNLAGTPITCFNSAGAVQACATPANYPAGSNAYIMTQSTTNYVLPFTNTPLPVTNTTGTPLAALPTVGTGTFCDPYMLYVYQPTATLGTYNVFNTAGCSATAITTATTAPAVSLGTVTIAQLATGNANVPNVLQLSGWTGTALTANNIANSNYIYAVRAGGVYAGWVNYPGYINYDENKTAINAEVVATGFVAIP